ncbi:MULTISPECIES: EF-hand domain-containing protein [Mameliella]|uniref:EF-hand domain-containing protein n=1 Tax=Mameliella TaxID=1434019 RepID=UPI00273FE9BD|nr:EF-hand domain-containing protein [Mameliella sp. MMSF_3537]
MRPLQFRCLNANLTSIGKQAKEAAMKHLGKSAIVLSIALLGAAPAFADNNHHGEAKGPAAQGAMGSRTFMEGNMPMAGGDASMMQNMMRMMMMMMHGGGMNPGAGNSVGMGIMDQDMMRMMMGNSMMGGMDGGMEPGQMMQSRLKEYDADGDGALGIDEFASWHAAMMREQMVDRFQHLDADGDGKITPQEMGAFAGRLKPGTSDMGQRGPLMSDQN